MTPAIIDAIVAKFGSQAEVAAICGKSQSAIAMWKRRQRIPSDDIQLLLNAAHARNIPLTPADFFDLPAAPAPEAA